MARFLALTLLLAVLFVLFRFAMGLRYAKRERERARLAEDDRVLAWGGTEVSKAAIVGARLLVNGAVLRECARRPGALPAPLAPEEYEGRDRWEVALFLEGGNEARIPCGTLREGVSREIAARAFEAARAAVGAPAVIVPER